MRVMHTECPIIMSNNLNALTSDDLISEITAEVSGLPYAERVAAVRAHKKLLERPEAIKLNYTGPSTPATLSFHNAVDRRLPIKTVHARRGKYVRAEPIASLYEQGRVHHVGRFPTLEDQMCTWTPEVSQSQSPDRADALVYAVTNLLQERRPMYYSL